MPPIPWTFPEENPMTALIQLLITLLSNPQMLELIKLIISLFSKVEQLMQTPEYKQWAASTLAQLKGPPAP